MIDGLILRLQMSDHKAETMARLLWGYRRRFLSFPSCVYLLCDVRDVFSHFAVSLGGLRLVRLGWLASDARDLVSCFLVSFNGLRLSVWGT